MYGTGDGKFLVPEHVAVASNGSVYVSDLNHPHIQRFTSEGVFVSKWSTEDSGEEELDPHGIGVAPDGSVYVADYLNNRIQKFTSEGVFVNKWGTWGSGDGEFWYPE